VSDYWIKKRTRDWALYERDNSTGKTRVISYADTLDAAKVQLRSQKPVETRQYAERNLDLLQRWWTKEYARRKLAKKSISSMRSSMDKMIAGLGGLEIENSNIEDLQIAIDRMSDQRRMAMCFNILRKFSGKEGRVYPNRQSTPDVEYISLPTLQQLTFKSDLMKVAAFTAFGTGARFGEMFTIKRSGLVVRIAEQRYEDWTLGNPKRGQGRYAPVISECRPYVEAWIAIPEEEKKIFRRKTVSKDMRKLIGISWHALRHSYAIHLLEAGFSLEETAKALGNSIAVCERYYSGYVLDEVAATRLSKRV
jgi:integrase